MISNGVGLKVARRAGSAEYLGAMQIRKRVKTASGLALRS